MASGVGVADEVVSKFHDIKLGHKHKYLILNFTPDSTQIEIEKVGELDSVYEDFVKELPADDCRYAIYDFNYETPEGGQRNKLIFFVWAPDTAKIKKKMLVASSKDAVRKKLIGIATEIQATDLDEVDYQEVLAKVSSGKA